MRDREKGSGIREQKTEIREQALLTRRLGQKDEFDPMKQLLQSAIPRIDKQPELDRDLWPAMLQRMDTENVRSAARIPWFDWALAGGLLAFAAVVPRTIPVILYYL
jgi:hypothetical protein